MPNIKTLSSAVQLLPAICNNSQENSSTLTLSEVSLHYLAKKFHNLCETRSFVTYLQQPATRSYLEPDESNLILSCGIRNQLDIT